MAKSPKIKGETTPIVTFKQVTPLLKGGVTKIGRLRAADITRGREQVVRLLRKAGCRLAFGAMDVSVEEYSDHPLRNHYAIHPHFIMEATQYPAFKAAITPHLVTKRIAKAPLTAKTWKFDQSGIAYMFQHAADRRTNPDKPLIKNGKVTKKARPNPARVSHIVEISLALDELGLEKKTFFIGLRPSEKNTKPAIVKLQEKNRGSGAKHRVEASKVPADGKDPDLEAKIISNYRLAQLGRIAPSGLRKKRAKRAERAELVPLGKLSLTAPAKVIREKGGKPRVSPQPEILVNFEVLKIANIVDLATGDAYERLRFKTVRGEFSDIILPREKSSDLSALRAALPKANWQAPPDHEEVLSTLRRFIASVPTTMECAVGHVGWIDDDLTSFALPDAVLGKLQTPHGKLIPPLRLENDQLLDCLPRGTLAGWQENIATPALMSSRIMLLICAAFAGPLLKATNLQPFGVHLYGPFKRGKSAAQMAAASVAGRGAEEDLPSFNATENMLQDAGRRKNDLAYIINDASMLRGGKRKAYEALSPLYYALSSGRSRDRMSASAHYTPEISSKTRVIASTSGEHSLDEYAELIGEIRPGGELVRCLDLPVISGRCSTIIDQIPKDRKDSFTEKDCRGILKDIRDACGVHHGVAIRPYLEYILRLPDLKLVVEQYQKEINSDIEGILGPNSTFSHMSINISLLYAGGRLAIDAGILPWRVKRLRKSIFRCYRDAVAVMPSAPPTEPSIEDLIDELIAGLELGSIAPGTSLASKCGEGYGVGADNEVMYLVHSDHFRKTLGAAQAERSLAFLLKRKRLVERKKPYVRAPGTEWAVRMPRWPDGRKRRTFEFRWPRKAATG